MAGAVSAGTGAEGTVGAVAGAAGGVMTAGKAEGAGTEDGACAHAYDTALSNPTLTMTL